MTQVPERFARSMREVFGERGEVWLQTLPERLREYERRWSLRVGPPVGNLTYNYVAPAERADGSAAVLKLGVPNKELASEIAALARFDGRGAVRLLEADADGGAMLLERLVPGNSLLTVVDDAEATRLAAGVMRELWRPASAEHPFATVDGWSDGFGRLRSRFDSGTGPLPEALATRAEREFAELLATSAPVMLLHGDLHHDNLLDAGGGRWLAIDPKGLVGEPAYETGALLLNPRGPHCPRPLWQWSDLDAVLATRLRILAEELGFAPERMRRWAFAQAVLSACWSVEDHGYGWEPALELAERFAALHL